jgi:hypothetical protein
MVGRKTKLTRVAVAASLLFFSAGTVSTPALAQENCHDWAKAYCASIGVPGNPQCIAYWTTRCEQGGGSPHVAAMAYKLD